MSSEDHNNHASYTPVVFVTHRSFVVFYRQRLWHNIAWRGWGGLSYIFLFKVGKTSEGVSTNFVMIVALHLYGYFLKMRIVSTVKFC